MHVWGCLTKNKFYNLYESKLDPKIASRYVIDYPETSKGCIVYYPNHNMRKIALKNVKFIEFNKISGSMKSSKVIIEKVQVDISIPITLEMIVVLLIDHYGDTLKQVNDHSSQINTSIDELSS